MLSKVEAGQGSVLLPGEAFKAAGTATNTAPRIGLGVGNTKVAGVKVPDTAIWVVTNKRFLMWSASSFGGSPKELLLALDLGPGVRFVGLGKERREMAIAVELAGVRLQRTMPQADAKAIAVALRAAPPKPSWFTPVDPYLGDDRLRQVVHALRDGDWASAEQGFDALGDVRAREPIVSGTALEGIDGHPPSFDEWARARPSSAAARTVRGAHMVRWGWQARGFGRATTVEENAWEVFHSRLRAAEDDLFAAVDLDPDDPLPWSALVVSGRGLGIPTEELMLRFGEVERRAPGLVCAHLQLLQGVCRKWGGSHDEMFGFARSHAAGAPAGSPLGALVPIAHVERWIDFDDDDAAMRGYWSGEVRDEIIENALRSVLDPSWVDGPEGVPALNAYALTLLVCGESDLAHEVGRRIGTRRTSIWGFFNKADEKFHRVTTGRSPTA